ncbi:DotU family type IV/VI secretion system protein [Sphingomonas sp. DG1-23]|uniref:DotU family type IV/VI secretion system protein n=1 Tax=Sphingomonas sp. DG1-23 TaxID=3068316 RepID=UPI00273F014C|nr:DotU family type IV/VI secretion system protein [Sphingomonas sp. DG1-23]MDP5280600.1 DotU family type IV/VI secretion system protein [Sphingomonas sp. DG1-23]
MKAILLAPQEQIAAEQFRSFYARLVELRDAVLSPAPPAMPEGASEPILFHRPTIEDVRAALRQAILAAGYRPEDDLGAAVDPGYVMAAVADEVLLIQCLDWPEHEAWTDLPLEAILYGTSLAGDRIFEAAQELIARRRDDPRTATVILLAFMTGFRGRYHGRDDRGIIAAMEQGLYQLVCRRPYVAGDPAPYAAPNLNATTLIGQSMRPLPVLWPWLVALTAVLLAYLPLSHLIWWSDVRKIDKVADSIVELHENNERRSRETIQ